MDALTVVVGFKQRHTEKPLRGNDTRGVLRTVNQAPCRLWVSPAPGAVTYTEGQDECSSWDRSSLNLLRLILQSPQQKEKKSGLQVPGRDLSLQHNIALVFALSFQGGRAR